jgi:hypothetical protein
MAVVTRGEIALGILASKKLRSQTLLAGRGAASSKSAPEQGKQGQDDNRDEDKYSSNSTFVIPEPARAK